MKSFRFMFLAVILAVGIASCEGDQIEENTPPNSDEEVFDENAPTMKFKNTDVGITAEGGAESLVYDLINVKDGDASKIKVVCDAEWLTVDTSTLNIVTFEATPNTTDANRLTTVVLSYDGGNKAKIDVVQGSANSSGVKTVEVEITSVGATTITFNVTASHPDLTWIPMVTYKEHWTEPINHNEIVTYDLEYFQYLADNYGVSLKVFLEEMLGEGSQKDITVERLDPETEYVVYVYGLSLEGERLTDVAWDWAATEKAWEGDITFEFDINEQDYIMEFVVTPSHLGVDYYYGVASEAEVEQWKKLAASDDLAQVIQVGDIDAMIDMLLGREYIRERKDYYDMCNASNVVDDGWERVKAGTKYILYAAKWNENCELTGAVSTAEYTTPEAPLSDNVLTMALSDITQSSVRVKVTTTNNDPYVVLPVKSEVIDGMTDSEIFEFVMSEYDYIISEYTFTGDCTRVYSRMRPDVKYTLLAFGTVGGVQTTKMLKEEITTLASGDPKDCTFECQVVPSWDSAWVEIIPSDKGHFFNWMAYPADFTATDVKAALKNIIDTGYEGEVAVFSSWELTQGDVNYTVFDLLPTTEYKIGIVIMDYDTGEFLSDVHFSDVFKTTEPVYADIDISVVWDEYYDADELVAAGHTQFSTSTNKCILPVQVNIEGDYSSFSFAFYNHDLTDEKTYPDKMFYQDLYYGNTFRSGIIDVPFDTTITAVAVAYDGYETACKLFRKAVCFDREGRTPASEFGAQKSSFTPSPSLVIASENVAVPVKAERKPSTDAQLAGDKEQGLRAKDFVENLRIENLEQAIEHRRADDYVCRVAR